jgi:hypothetical protein
MRRRRTMPAPLAALALTAALAAPAPVLAQTSAAPASQTAPASTTAPAGSTAPAVPTQTSKQASDVSTGAIVLLAVLGLILLVVAATLGVARWWAWEPRWWLRTRHATAEAGWRTSATWAECRDWLRLGR